MGRWRCSGELSHHGHRAPDCECLCSVRHGCGRKQSFSCLKLYVRRYLRLPRVMSPLFAAASVLSKCLQLKCWEGTHDNATAFQLVCHCCRGMCRITLQLKSVSWSHQRGVSKAVMQSLEAAKISSLEVGVWSQAFELRVL